MMITQVSTQDWIIGHKIKNIFYRQTLNSHCKWTGEWVLELASGVKGVGTSPQGETLSIYEDGYNKKQKYFTSFKKGIFSEIRGKTINQLELDQLLNELKPVFGQNNTFALSLAFFDAVRKYNQIPSYRLLQFLYNCHSTDNQLPKPLLNVLNGGLYAYTNPILSDFTEYLLVPNFEDITDILKAFRQINTLIKERLNKLSTMKVGRNWVYCQDTKLNHVWIEFLLDILDQSGFSDSFGIMIDASAGNLWDNGRYRFTLTNYQSFTTTEFCQYWSEMLSIYPITILEDPFYETHNAAWAQLLDRFPQHLIAGDNLCATNEKRIHQAACENMVSAVLIKPNQAGTVSATVSALKAGINNKLTIIPSHRSMETESTFLSDLIHAFGCGFAKLGLLTDFETIIKINKLLRYHLDCRYEADQLL